MSESARSSFPRVIRLTKACHRPLGGRRSSDGRRLRRRIVLPRWFGLHPRGDETVPDCREPDDVVW